MSWHKNKQFGAPYKHRFWASITKHCQKSTTALIVALFDTLSDSTQCFPKNYSIQKFDSTLLTKYSIQTKLWWFPSKDNSIQNKIWWFNSTDISIQSWGHHWYWSNQKNALKVSKIDKKKGAYQSKIKKTWFLLEAFRDEHLPASNNVMGVPIRIYLVLLIRQ